MSKTNDRGGARIKQQIIPIVIVAVLFGLSFLTRTGSALRPSYYVVLFVSILNYIVLAVSWNIFSGPSGYISLSTAAFFGLGIYVSALLGEKLPVPLLMIVAGVISFAIAAIIGVITLRLRGVYFTIFTFGLVLLLQYFILWYEVKFNNLRGRTVMAVPYNTVFICLLILAGIVLIAAYYVKRSRFGMALTGIGECEDAAAHIGVNTTMVKVIAFAATSFAIGASGAAKATTMIYIDPPIAFNVMMSFMPVLMVIFGGAGSFLGPIIGAIVFTLLQEQLTTKWPKWYMIIFGVVMIISIVFLPKGLVGSFGEMVGKRKKLLLIAATAVFMVVGFIFTKLLAAAGTNIGGLVFPLLFGIIGFVIFANVLKRGKEAA
ncbi:MAG: branched-chain amino acid ABC transporter permease [Lachnospiraceae bacterium]|nr:branched-chain amino acid ABC transporter permease [Lachnospiraceae bacterium]